MSKIAGGRISGLDGMKSPTSAELFAWGDRLEAQIKDPANRDDPKWLQRWAGKLRDLAIKKHRAIIHKVRRLKKNQH